jgi:acyl dehydratase
MTARELRTAPKVLPLYARAAAPLVPGASHLPFVPGGGGEIPDLELRLSDAPVEPARVAAYAKVCGFTLRDTVPATYPHVLAFPLHMALMADGRFPFGAIGLVHVGNRIEQRRPVRIGEPLSLRVRASGLEPHPRGRTFSILTEALVGDEPVWEETSTILRRGGGGGADGAPAPAAAKAAEHEPLPASAEWHLPGDLGRRYAAVSGDRNPIHMHALTARALGFPRAIAHGMWTKARCLAALEPRLPAAYSVDVRFRRPLLLPGTVEFGSSAADGAIDFFVRGAEPHLDGRVEPAS